jgi:hypothetical protein
VGDPEREGVLGKVGETVTEGMGVVMRVLACSEAMVETGLFRITQEVVHNADESNKNSTVRMSKGFKIGLKAEELLEVIFSGFSEGASPLPIVVASTSTGWDSLACKSLALSCKSS